MKHNPDDYHEKYLRHWEEENKKYKGPRDGGLTESEVVVWRCCCTSSRDRSMSRVGTSTAKGAREERLVSCWSDEGAGLSGRCV